MCIRDSFSTRHITRRFKAATGLSLNEYLLNQRIAGAKSLLASTPKKVAEVALETGFGNASYFCQQFKRVTGYTPNEYREISRDVYKRQPAARRMTGTDYQKR